MAKNIFGARKCMYFVKRNQSVSEWEYGNVSIQMECNENLRMVELIFQCHILAVKLVKKKRRNNTGFEFIHVTCKVEAGMPL